MTQPWGMQPGREHSPEQAPVSLKLHLGEKKTSHGGQRCGTARGGVTVSLPEQAHPNPFHVCCHPQQQ